MSNHHGRELPRSRTDRPYSGSRQFLAQAADFKCIDDFVVTNWRAVVGPKGMSAAQVAYWDGVLAKTLAHDKWTRDIAHNLRDGSFLLSADTAKFFVGQQEEFRQSLADIGLTK